MRLCTTRHRTPTPLWSDDPRPAEELAIEHGITGPQGLRAVEDPDWEDDEQERAFLAFVMGDDDAFLLARGPLRN